MDIRNVAKGLLNIADTKAVGSARERKAGDASKDRDANGRREDQGDSPEKRKLTEDEIKRAQDYLAGLKGVGEHGLKVHLEDSAHFRVFVIEGPDGKVVRRIPEYEMIPLLRDQDKKTGQVFHKTA